MATFKGAELVCQVCGAKFKVPTCRAKTATTCSHECSVTYRASGLMRDLVPYTCQGCGITKFTHKSHASVRVYCSNRCKHAHAGALARGKGLSKGENNGMWRGGLTLHPDGYIYENSYNHPFSSDNRVLQHRLVVERHLRETNPDSACLVTIGDNRYLNPELVVHHKDLDRKNNKLDNLQVMTNADHQALHNRLRAKTK